VNKEEEHDPQEKEKESGEISIPACMDRSGHPRYVVKAFGAGKRFSCRVPGTFRENRVSLHLPLRALDRGFHLPGGSYYTLLFY